MDNLWTRCNNCQKILYKQDILDNRFVCPSCNFHFRLAARDRLEMMFDEGKFEVLDENIFPVDILHFEDTQKYTVRLEENQKKTGLSEAVVNARLSPRPWTFSSWAGAWARWSGKKLPGRSNGRPRKNRP
jgi:acetyl-CoA carboxylase carboxyl transferase subunit beta